MRVHIFKDLEKARRLPVRVEEQQAQQLAVNPPRSAGDGNPADGDDPDRAPEGLVTNPALQ